MAYRFPPPAPLHNSQENTAINNSTKSLPPMLPLQVFSVPPPPIPPSLPLLLPSAALQQYHNIPSQVYSIQGVLPPVQKSDLNASVDACIGMGGYQITPQLPQLCKNSDEIWVKDWLARKKPQPSNSTSSAITLKICQARECLKMIISQLNHFKSVQQHMVRGLNSMDLDSWESALNDIQHKAGEFEASLSEFENKKIIEDVKKAIATRSKKRDSQKRRRLVRREMRAESFARRQQLHRSIDSWLKDMQGAVEKAKIDESLKAEADTILSDVTRKKTEARRQLALLSSLLKLHQLRVKTASSKGEHISAEHGIRFCKVTDHLRILWEKQLKEYNLEEQGLRLMLNEAVDERDHSRVRREKLNLKHWELLLFGEKQGNIPDFYTAAENDLEAFINTRRHWDKFITSSEAPMSSAIPIGWVLPTLPSSDQWETLLSSMQSAE
ncbi:programmed cell death protein 7 [Anabrus simplex]|uniref:programmed cell death protein 7 n=1 Tax=Anabrus simplex TaxID=316456 RepID=UPI0035A3A14F